MSSSIWTYQIIAIDATGAETTVDDGDLSDEWEHNIEITLSALPAGTVKLRVECD